MKNSAKCVSDVEPTRFRHRCRLFLTGSGKASYESPPYLCTFFWGSPWGCHEQVCVFGAENPVASSGVNALSSSLLLSRFWSSRMHWFLLWLMRGQFCARGARRESTSARSKRNLFGGRSEGWRVFKLVLKSVRLRRLCRWWFFLVPVRSRLYLIPPLICAPFVVLLVLCCRRLYFLLLCVWYVFRPACERSFAVAPLIWCS